MIAPLLYLAAIVGTNVSFSIAGPVLATFLLAGLTMVARDFVHEVGGRRLSFLLVALGAALSVALAGPGVAVASGVAFLVAETLDLLVYDVLRKRTRIGGVALSGTVGSVVDSLVFLSIAFGSLAFFDAQVIGKLAATFGAAAVLAALQGARRLRAA